MIKNTNLCFYGIFIYKTLQKTNESNKLNIDMNGL